MARVQSPETDGSALNCFSFELTEGEFKILIHVHICITSFYTTLQYWRKYFIGYLIEELAPFTISTVAIYAYVDILPY